MPPSSAPQIVHATCPAKRDIYPPIFELTETMQTTKFITETWRCAGCATEIRTFTARD